MPKSIAAGVSTKEPLLTLVERLAPHIDRSEVTISFKVCPHGRLFSNLRRKRGCHIDTYRKALSWFDQNWPPDPEWPPDVPRPSRQKQVAA
jgi:hypothetical protein